MMHKRHKQHAGFTLVELMVAVSILGLMLFLINELFQTTSVAVTTSVQQSKSIATTRLLGEQIETDTNAMLGPTRQGGGYLVIIQRRVRNVAMQDPTTLAEFTAPFIRSDQVVFIRDAGGMRSMTPQDRRSYRSNLIGEAGGYAKVWYGHPQRTNNDGSIPGNSGAFQLGGPQSGFDRVGSDWMLGRQAMLFNPTDPLRLPAPATAPADHAKVSGNPSAYTFADNAFYGSAVQNTTYNQGPRNVSSGLTDVTRQDYRNQAPGNAVTPLLTQLTDPTLTPAQQNLAYLNTAYRLFNAPLRVNPSPTGTNYASWGVAQSHGILATNCSDFVVEFAADLNGNGRIDTTPGGNANDIGAIFWYDSLETDPNLRVNWNGSTWQNLSGQQFQPYVPLNGDYRTFVFKVNDDARFSTGNPTSAWPYLLRLRYRLHGNRGRLAGNDPSALTDRVDNDGDGQADNADPENNEDQIPGQWFEHIIRVPRP